MLTKIAVGVLAAVAASAGGYYYWLYCGCCQSALSTGCPASTALTCNSGACCLQPSRADISMPISFASDDVEYLDIAPREIIDIPPREVR